MKIFGKKLSEKTIFEKILKKWKKKVLIKNFEEKIFKKLRNEKFWKKFLTFLSGNFSPKIFFIGTIADYHLLQSDYRLSCKTRGELFVIKKHGDH